MHSISSRTQVAGRLAPVVALAFVPKCGLCVVAWAAALAGLGAETCGSGPSWTILAPMIARRLGLSVGGFDALCLLFAACGTVAYFRWVSRFGR